LARRPATLVSLQVRRADCTVAAVLQGGGVAHDALKEVQAHHRQPRDLSRRVSKRLAKSASD